MNFRSFLEKLDRDGQLVKVKKPVSKKLETSGILNALSEQPVLFEKIKESNFKVAGNIYINWSIWRVSWSSCTMPGRKRVISSACKVICSSHSSLDC